MPSAPCQPAAPAAWTNPELELEIATLLRVRTQVNETIEPLRAAGKLGKSLDAAVTLMVRTEDPVTRILEKHRDFLPELFIVSHVTMESQTGAATEAARESTTTDATKALHVSVQPCSELNLSRCPRYWRWVPALAASARGEVCPRCAEALEA